MAAGQVYRDNQDDDGSPDFENSDDPLVLDAENCIHGHHAHGYGDTAEAYIPVIDFTAQPNPCGCVGLCEHIIQQDDAVEEFLV